MHGHQGPPEVEEDPVQINKVLTRHGDHGTPPSSHDVRKQVENSSWDDKLDRPSIGHFDGLVCQGEGGEARSN